MAIKLLSKKLLLTLHIALLVLFVSLNGQAIAQSVLLPGDVVVVSANGSTGSIDFIPLIDVEKGTELYFNNGSWDKSTKTLNGEELKVLFNENVEAGTNLHVNGVEDSRIAVSGSFGFEGDTRRIFVYQKDTQLHRFLFAVAWGSGPFWNTNQNKELSDLPQSLSETPNTVLTLGEGTNFQYYIRNGASGTRDLLLKMVGEPTSWRSQEEEAFSVFGTSFHLLEPPVIIFDESVSRVDEGDSLATIAIAIYAHDGSRLSVDVVFDSSRSIIDYADIAEFQSKTINFTGLVGDGIYKIKVPILDDELYEGRETGIFTLKNLTGGNFGDFLTHSMMVIDNEIPDLLISKVVNTEDGTGYVHIRNAMEGVVSLSGWSLSGNDQVFEFSDSDVIYPGEVIKIIDSSNKLPLESEERMMTSNLKKPLLKKKGGNLTLRDYKNEIIYQVNYAPVINSKANDVTDKMVLESVDKNELDESTLDQFENQMAVLQATNPGWKLLTEVDGLKSQFSDKEIYIWSEEIQDFVELGATEGSQSPIYLAYFEASEMKKLTDWSKSNQAKQMPANILNFTLSATDKNNNKVIDGVEGLNLVYNSMDQPLVVSRLIDEIQAKYSNIEIGSSVYGLSYSSSGELNFMNLGENAEVAPGAAFWLSVNNPLTATRLQIDTEPLLEENAAIKDSDEERADYGLFRLSLTDGMHNETLDIQIGDDVTLASVKDLNSYPDMFLESPSFLNMAIHQGGDYFKQLSITDDIKQQLQFPVHFNSSREGEFNFTVSEWEDIPSDWDISLMDLMTDKEYDLRKDFSMTFEHSNTSLNSFIDEERFVIFITPSASKISKGEVIQDKPRTLELNQNYPNPFNPVTTISFYLPESQEVRLSVFNIVGQPVAVITEGTLSAGQHQFEWDATDKPSGMYIYQLEVGKSVMTRKMTLVK